MNSKSFYLVILGGVVIAGLAGAYFFMQKQEARVEELSKEEQVKEENTEEEKDEGPSSSGVEVSSVIVYTDAGFAPFEYVVKKGNEVTFVNTSSRAVWPASAGHPTHTVYPGTNINKCNTAQEQDMFDSCRGIAPGQEWSFRFAEVGSWTYHDHLNATKTGIIVVRE